MALINNRDICGVTQKAFVFNNKDEILILKRTDKAPSRPNEWDLPGGSLDFGEDPTNSIEREILEEASLEVNDLVPFDLSAEIDKEGEFWTTVAYRARAKSDKVKLSFEHNDYRWVTLKDFPNYTESIRFLRYLKKLI